MVRVEPDQAALEVAHLKMRTSLPLAEVMKDPSLRVIARAVARRHMQQRLRFDAKKLQANDQGE